MVRGRTRVSVTASRAGVRDRLGRSTRALCWVAAALVVATAALATRSLAHPVVAGTVPDATRGPLSVPGEGAERLTVGSFLVARADLPDPNFFETVVVLFAYDEQDGAAGLVVNRPTGMSVGDIISEDGPFAGRPEPLFLGGPVSVESILVLHRASEPADGATHVVGDVYLLAEKGGLESVLESPEEPESVEPGAHALRFFAGYAGWSPGQLEDEISRGVWHVMAGDPARVFTETPREDWRELIRIVFGPRA